VAPAPRASDDQILRGKMAQRSNEKQWSSKIIMIRAGRPIGQSRCAFLPFSAGRRTQFTTVHRYNPWRGDKTIVSPPNPFLLLSPSVL